MMDAIGDLESLDANNSLEALHIGTNRFRGTIPQAAFGNKRMSSFDVGSNLLTGYFDLNIMPITTSSEMKAEVNRLSGVLDTSSLERYSSVDLLNGNVFSCSTIPNNDQQGQKYVCGSIDYEVSVYHWLFCLLLFGAIFLYFHD